MSSGETGRSGLSQIPAALQAVLTTAQQYLLLDTVRIVHVNDLRRALCDAEFAERLVQRPAATPPVPVAATVQSRTFSPRAATAEELAAAAEGASLAAAQRLREVSLLDRIAEAGQRAVARRREAEIARQEASVRLSRRLEAEAAARAAAEERRNVADTLRDQSRLRDGNRRRRPAPPQAGASSTPGFDTAIRTLSQSAEHRPGYVPVLGGQAGAREETLAQARASRVPIDWDSETMWRLNRSPRAVPSVRISHMSDQQLVDEIEDTVVHVDRIFQLYAEGVWRQEVATTAPPIRAKQWLAVQPAFRAIVQEAARRDVALYGTSVRYIQRFVLVGSDDAQLADFVNHPVTVVTEEAVVDTFGRSGRALRLDDE